MKLHRLVILCTWAAILAMTTGVARAESLQQLIERLNQINGEAYLKPVADGLGADLNSGLYSTARPHGIGGFDFGVKVMAASVPDAARFFTPTPPSGYHVVSDDGTGRSPTAMGPDQSTARMVSDTNPLESYDLPGGLDFDFVPLAVPQVAVGVPYDTDVIVRYLPPIEINSDLGDASFFGIGVKHGLSRYLPMVPLDVSAYFMYQTLKVGDGLIRTSNLAYGVCASKSIPILTMYGGVQLERASMDVKYTMQAGTAGNPTASDIPINLSFDSDASSRATIGARITVLPLIFVQAEASKVFGSDDLGTVFGGGLGLKLR